MKRLLSFVVVVLCSACSNPVSPTPDPQPTPQPAQQAAQAPAPQPQPQPPAPAAPTPTPTSGTITIHVQNRTNGRAIQNAEIDLDFTFRGMTDAAGNLPIAVDFERAYNVVVYQGEFMTLHATSTFHANENTVTFQLDSLR